MSLSSNDRKETRNLRYFIEKVKDFVDNGL